MSGGDGDSELVVVVFIIAAFVLVLLIFSGVDSLIQDSHIRDLQRRVGQLEQRSKD